MNTIKASCWFTEVTEVIDNKKYWGQKAKNIKATEDKDIEVTEARDIEAGKAIEVPEVAQFLEASAKPKIDTTRKERKTNSVSKLFSLQLLFVNFVNKPTNFLFLEAIILY